AVIFDPSRFFVDDARHLMQASRLDGLERVVDERAATHGHQRLGLHEAGLAQTFAQACGDDARLHATSPSKSPSCRNHTSTRAGSGQVRVLVNHALRSPAPRAPTTSLSKESPT